MTRRRVAATSFAFRSTYGYDKADRIASATRGGSTQSYAYDTLGRRLSQVNAGATSSYRYEAGKNRLQQIVGVTPRTYASDANGSVTSNGVAQFTYDARGRLTKGIMINLIRVMTGRMFMNGQAAKENIRVATIRCGLDKEKLWMNGMF